ncbi:kyphoscoliosis peptidase [Dryobates pubescens]|uniref:kyphoscoliosis peptidase n=1 Tax=Dryobates pubescens TaxID=118200 RepID=UPI0023B9C22E|nr:kyphoscoliosis peptidase [Dryobates pubescens]
MGTMDFKADPSAVSINLLLIVHPEEAASKQKGPREGQTEGSQSPGLQDDGNGNSSSQSPQGRDLQGQQVCKEPCKQPQAVTPYSSKGPQVTVEIHPKDSPPQLFKKLSFGKGPRRLPSLSTQDDKGSRTTEAPRPPGGKDLHAYPWDRSSLKSLPVDLQQLEKLDAYALKVDVKSSVEELVRALLKQARSDLEKVRAIWMWICHHIEYDVVGYHNKSQLANRPLDVLQAGKGICEGYAGLFEHMCSLAGIQCMKLFGYSKGNGYRTGQTFTGDSDHAWNAVYLDGRWHLLDSTWGSGSVDDSFTKFTFRYNEFYFLTHPALFINNHFPDNSNWQLLKPALTLKDFENNLLRNSNFYTLGLLAAHPQTAVIQTVNGKASVSVDCRPATLFTFKLRGTAQQGLLTLKRQGMQLDVYPQKTGSHKLQIFAKPSRGSGDVYQCVLEYLVECRSVDAALRLPRELPQPVGPSWLSERRGFLRPSHPGPVVHTNDGRCSLTFTLGRDVLVLASLQGEGGSLPEELGMQHVMAVRRGAQLELKVQLPRAGSFVLKLYAKKKSEPGNYDYVFNYLLSCLNAEVRWPAFPLSYSKWGQDYEVLEPLAGVLPAARNVRFRLRMQGVAKVLVQAEGSYPLTHNRGYWEGSCSTAGCSEVFVMVHENANHSFYSHVLKYQVESQ